MSETADLRIFGLRPRGARWALGLSLALNFLVLGVAGGAAHKMWGGFAPRFHLSERVIDAAGPERREAVRALVGRKKDGRAEWRAEWRADWARMAEIIDARPFDAATLSAVLAGSDERRAARNAMRHAAMAEALSLLTDQERAALAEDMRDSLKRWGED
ncbi:MAG: periplasmic heavy metal sensor [Pikeienuella sp.]